MAARTRYGYLSSGPRPPFRQLRQAKPHQRRARQRRCRHRQQLRPRPRDRRQGIRHHRGNARCRSGGQRPHRCDRVHAHRCLYDLGPRRHRDHSPAVRCRRQSLRRHPARQHGHRPLPGPRRAAASRERPRRPPACRPPFPAGSATAVCGETASWKGV